MTKLTYVSGLCVALIVLQAFADDQTDVAKHPDMEQSAIDAANKKFEMLDRNRDRHISLEEARQDPKLLKRFAVADANGDGQLDQAEFMSKPSEKPAQ